MSKARRRRVAILGAGAGGLGLAIRLRRAGIDDFVVFEAADGVGGTWRANTYPGAACDVPSLLYSYSFALKPDWSRTYATQPEILQYFEDCADRFGVRPHLRCNTPVRSARWDEPERCWRLSTEGGGTWTADVLVSALGMLRVPVVPAIDGLEKYSGKVMHSARWDHAHDLRGRRVAVVGTGASAIQIVPAIAPAVEQLHLFQRTPAWIMPRIDRPYTEEEQRRFARNPLAARRLRWDLYCGYERNTTFRAGDPREEQIRAFALARLSHRIQDPDLRARLTPDYPVGCKRVLVSSDFYPALLRENVSLVTEPIRRVTATAVETADGRQHTVDTIVLATGFRATEYLHGLEVVGTGGRNLSDVWAGEPRAHLGMTVSGFPNFFMLYGPNTNQGGNSIIFILEAQARYVAQAVQAMERHCLASLDVKQPVMDRYNRELDAALAQTVWAGGCRSYFQTPSGHIATQLPHPSRWYWWQTRRVRLADFAHGSI